MPLLLELDYKELRERGINFLEDEANRFLIFQDFELPEGIYVQSKCDVLVVIPANYNQDGNDMLWTYPRLVRINGSPIPNTDDAGSNSKTFMGKVFCRWSRHWNVGRSMWKPGKDDIVTIVRRISWAFEHPDTK